MRVSGQKAVETPVHRETTLEAERSKSRRRREARIPTQAENPETNCRMEERHVRWLTEKPETNRRPEESVGGQAISSTNS